MLGGEDDWAGRQADRILAANRREAAQLGRLRQRPFGLKPGSWPPGPVRISAEAFKVSPRSALAFVTRSPVPRSSMALRYGEEEDPSAVLVEVITDFSRGYEDSESLEDTLWLAAHRGLADGPSSPSGVSLPDADEPGGPFERGETSILVEGVIRQVPTLAYQHYRVLRFGSGRVLVTVITRHQVPGPSLSLVRVADLSRYASGLDRETAALREELRQHIRGEAPSP